MPPVNQLCSLVDCSEPRAANSHLCAHHRLEIRGATEGRVRPASPTCAEPGCDQAVHFGPSGRTYKYCREHVADRVRAGQRAARDRRANGRAPEPEPVTADADPEAETAAVTALAEQAAMVGAELVPGMLESLIRDALAANPAALKLRVTGLKVAFSGEIEIAQE